MSLIKKQLALAITLALGSTATQYAQALADMEPNSEWLSETPLEGQRQYVDAPIPAHDPALPVPEAFYFANHATSRNGLSVARLLDTTVQTLLASGQLTPWEEYELGNVLDYLSSQEPGKVGLALEQLAGSQNANLASATQKTTGWLTQSLLSAMRDLPAYAPGDNDSRLWVQGYGNTGTLSGEHGSAGLQQKNQGLVIGADWAVDHAWRLGVMGGKSVSDFGAKRFKSSLDSWHLGGYAIRQDGPLALRLGAVYSSHEGQNKRSVDIDFLDFKEQLTGQYTAQSQNAFAELGYQMGEGNISIEPFAGIGFQRYHRDRFKEKGGLTALNVDDQTQQNLSSTFGIRLATRYTLDDQMSLTPHLSTSWKRLYGDVGSAVRQSSRLYDEGGLNSDFTILGTSLDRNSLAWRTGLDLALSANHTLGVAYTGEVSTSSRGHGLMGQWQMSF
ncbi:autotransporter outer membrane beta-barrel domain-containing protein [Pseudomonas sp. 15FMM2]|uniref:Autotransporter outer membrane beta-barrel domain-containing protein n=1 Tax=Pseudomonas imrae TaxID=2992837 RepID=A0ACC7PEX2_9PSED